MIICIISHNIFSDISETFQYAERVYCQSVKPTYMGNTMQPVVVCWGSSYWFIFGLTCLYVSEKKTLQYRVLMSCACQAKPCLVGPRCKKTHLCRPNPSLVHLHTGDNASGLPRVWNVAECRGWWLWFGTKGGAVICWLISGVDTSFPRL